MATASMTSARTQSSFRQWLTHPKTRKRAVRYFVLLVALWFFLFPIYWIFSVAFKTPETIFHTPPIWGPTSATLQQFRNIIEGGYMLHLKNSLIISTSTTILTVAIAALASYAMSRFRTGGDDFSFWVISQKMLPPIAIVFPVFLLFSKLHWVDKHYALILLYTAFNLPFAIWMLKGFFDEVPLEVEESAAVDGCSRLGTIWRITMPLAVPGLVATAIFVFIFSWSEFLFALILTRTSAVTLAVGISAFYGPQGSLWGQVSALSIIATLPIFILGLAVQKHFVRGLTLGAVKG